MSVYSCSRGACAATRDNRNGMPGCVCLRCYKGNDALVNRSGGPAQRLGLMVVCGVAYLDACGVRVLFVYGVNGLVGSVKHPLNQLFDSVEYARRHVSASRLPAFDAIEPYVKKNSGLSCAETADFQKVVKVFHKYMSIAANTSGAKPPITNSIISSLVIVAAPLTYKLQIALVFICFVNPTNARHKFAVNNCCCHRIIVPALFWCANAVNKCVAINDVTMQANVMSVVIIHDMFGGVAKLMDKVVRVGCVALHDLVNNLRREVFTIKLKLIFVSNYSHNETLCGYAVGQSNRLVIVIYIQKTKHQAQNYGAPYVCSSGAFGAQKSAPTELWHYSIRRRRAPMRLRRIWGAAAQMPDTKLVPCGLVKDGFELRQRV